MSKDSPYKCIKGEFLSVSLLSTPGNLAMAPEGIGKFTHMNDGYLDLILVKDTAKKEFVRYLKRHGNHKNQVHCG